MSHRQQDSFLIEPMTTSHIDEAVLLCRDAGWNQLHADWQRLIAYEPDGCYVAMCDEQLAGTVTTTRYGSRLGWIGMMLVHPRFRRRGIATALIQKSIKYLKEHDVQCIKLDATPVGKKVYEKLGFKAEWLFHRWRRAGSITQAETELGDTTDLTAFVIEIDREGFGVDRCEYIQRLADGSFVHVVGDGYGMLRPGYLASYLGPVMSRTTETAASMIIDLCSRTERDIFWDIPGPNILATEIARRLGFEPARDLLRMWTGEKRIHSNHSTQYALADPGTG